MRQLPFNLLDLFSKYINGCLTCDAILNRTLKGLKCECSFGYYEDANICLNCPVTQDSSLSQCYVLCDNNQLIWFSTGCQGCSQGFHMVNTECQPICGDLVVVGNEECDDNNTDLNDKCFNCRFQCPANCQTCDKDTILPCLDVCGDGLITGNEECEDGNNIQFDGCYNCKYQCQQSCTKCFMGECNECAEGWYIVPYTWRCKERCGDQMIVGEESCEDGNQIDTDGCKECRFVCRIGCSQCDGPKCLLCEFPGFIPYQYYCKNNCGDGIVVVDPMGSLQKFVMMQVVIQPAANVNKGINSRRVYANLFVKITYWWKKKCANPVSSCHIKGARIIKQSVSRPAYNVIQFNSQYYCRIIQNL